MARLCLCVNQIARIRNFNKRKEPDPVSFAVAAEIAGADGIVVQLRNDRSDITDRDVMVLKEVVNSHLNLAIPLNDDMVKKAVQILPDMVTLLPDSRELLTDTDTLDVEANFEYIEDVAAALRANNIVVNVLIHPSSQQIRAAARAGLDYVQINTMSISKIVDLGSMSEQIDLYRSISIAANKLGLGVAAGRGLDYQNIREIAGINLIEEMNVGRSIIARSLVNGIEKAVITMKTIVAGS